MNYESEKFKKLDLLFPSRNQQEKSVKARLIPKQKRPELFPVKPEHMTPVQYESLERQKALGLVANLNSKVSRQFQMEEA